MRKKMLVTGMMLITAISLSACAGKETSATTTEETVIETELSSEVTSDSAIEEEDTSDRSEVLNEEEGKKKAAEFAVKIQKAVEEEDQEAIAEMSSYPLYVSMEAGEGEEVKDKEAFMKIDSSKLFSDQLKEEIAEVDPESLEAASAGIILGSDVNITFSEIDGEMKITAFNL